MPIEQTSIHCQHCKQLRLHTRSAPNHLVHALVTLFLCGLWIPIWIIAASSTNPFRCNTCGVINQHSPPPAQPLKPQAIGAALPTDWHKNLKVIGLIAGIIGLFLIIGVSLRSVDRSSQSTEKVLDNRTLFTADTKRVIDIKKILGQSPASIDKVLGKPLESWAMNSDPRRQMREYSYGQSLTMIIFQNKAENVVLFFSSPVKDAETAFKMCGLELNGEKPGSDYSTSEQVAQHFNNFDVGGRKANIVFFGDSIKFVLR